MELGWLDVCLSVASVAESRAFYEKLGFRVVEGSDSEGWVVIANHSARIGLFSRQFMGDTLFSLNFRGGNVPRIASLLKDAELTIVAEPKFVGKSGGSLKLRDPDGHLIFIDSTDGETQPN